MQERYTGCLLGLALGDALGAPQDERVVALAGLDEIVEALAVFELEQIRVALGDHRVEIVDESIAEIDRVCPGAKSVGVMATDGCLDTRLYQDAIEATGRHAIIPDEQKIADLMQHITSVKAGDQGPSVAEGMQDVARTLVDQGAEAIIAGCTEIPIVFDGDGFSVPVISSTDVLAQRTLSLATGQQPLPEKT